MAWVDGEWEDRMLPLSTALTNSSPPVVGAPAAQVSHAPVMCRTPWKQ